MMKFILGTIHSVLGLNLRGSEGIHRERTDSVQKIRRLKGQRHA